MKHLTSTVTFGSGATKEELDEIIRQSLALWPDVPDAALASANCAYMPGRLNHAYRILEQR